MAVQKGQKGKPNGKAASKATVTAIPVKIKPSSSSPSFMIALPGIVLAVAAALWYSSGDGGINGTNSTAEDGGVEPPATQQQSSHSSRRLLSPNPGSWTDGYYTIRPVEGQPLPSTQALLYPNGGHGEGEPISFSSDKEFLALGRLYNDLGQIVQSPSHFRNGTALYRGPDRPGTHFQWPAVRVGYKRAVPGVFGGNGEQIELETLTEPSDNARESDPRVFYVHNFLSPEEADEFVRFSTAEENPYKMAPSTGGTHKAWNQGGSNAVLTTRTSENAFDISTQNSRNVKQRAFRLLRMGGYKENLADGIQILRYELGQAYVAHHDYFPQHQSADHQWDPNKGGSNRFATIFLYLSDVEYGGETVFPNSDRLTEEKSAELVERLGESPPIEKSREHIRNAGLAEGSWEEKLTLACHAKFAVPPRRGDAILFYSQRPDGHLDANSLHGACPVLKGTKWGANLWVWNACRYSQCQGDPLHPAEELPEVMKAPFPGGV
eukprot:CAMPEP_0172533672 /NCGR_PEP_ID=MMETSP1067-20121228/6287_1 /TAXON_ID=265564 ORGANISM="Thalassiosira punctigera, Strain Tpunct2005C2" /NCGR_SAMPLE_ID=MMETSP1067 /ASSEMBLY_ACC=CAM_ASM_000444 /LENGTH=492 /DNA_ID=CAMNT_0013318337 /DNA_START=38 /DNA_END=1516 /DNA_ORIENTATION=+